ncbi:ABC transporter substrate-binding protein [Spirulina sp. CCNP1310]|uniref:ABC transporter substrate-binding protein n=1 Tax=Spirulina sp. CCNP1310 TaxID=3110249 RepID=UPI002B204599|nr:ABC transporter substrate-binding protein [Spirulina sp. CCNP1310]MEA5418946.1 ABC transporter substrate-binding protein [Spirulina sp. CCNP1310]
MSVPIAASPMSWSRRSVLALVGFGFTQLWGCRRSTSQDPSQPTLTPPDTVRIGILAPLKGTNALTDGLPTVQAAQLVAEAVNQAGGLEVYGVKRPVELIFADEGDRPDQALAAARKLMFQDQVIAIVGLPLSYTAIPVANFAETIPLPVISTTSTHPDTTAGKNYVFRAGFIDDVQGQVLAQFTQDTLKAERIAILYDIANVYSQGLAHTFMAAIRDHTPINDAELLNSLGDKIVAEETYTSDQQTDFRPALRRIQELEPDLLFLPNYPEEIKRQTAQARELGLTATFLGADAWDSPIHELPALEGSYYATHWYADPNNPQINQFIEAYQRAYDTAPNIAAALTYDALGLLIEAIRREGRTDAKAIQGGLQSIRDFPGVSGTLRFRGTGDPVKSIVIVQIQDGKPMMAQTITPGLDLLPQ